MVSYYNPVAMFGRTGTGHHHPHHTNPPQNPYFSGPYTTPAYHHHYPHSHAHHHQGGPTSAPGVVTSTQFSPNVPPDCNHPYQHQLGNMTPESVAAAAAGWHQPNVMYSACASRNMVPTGYDDWTHSHGYPHPHSFYHLQQPSPPNSTPSPNSTHNGEHHSPSGYPSHPHVFKTEFGSCSGGPQENSSQEMHSVGGNSSSGGVSLVSSASSSLVPVPTPHSPDSGMAISDGVSSSGSPATTGGNGHPHCLNNQHHQHHHLSSTTMIPVNPVIGVGQSGNLTQHTQNPNNHHHNSNSNGTAPTMNYSSTGRPTQARDPYVWLQKNSNSQVSSNSNGGKTRTKDKYRVVYSDTQRVELEKEYHYSRYITITRKSELAQILGLSERQVKIWFQNRRAKDRKTDRKHGEMISRGKEVHMHMQNAAMLSGTMNLGNGMCNLGNPHM